MRAHEFLYKHRLNEDIENFPIANVRRPNGAIGNQGVNTNQAADVLTHAAGMQVSPDWTMRQMVDALKADPAAQQRLRQFVQKNPITVYALPDGSYHLQDGHHRTFLLNLLGDETVPAVVKEGVAENFLNEGLSHPVIVVDVQPEYSGMNDGNESSVFPQIINFVNKQTGPVLMFVNAEDQGLSGDTIQDIKQYWDDTICPEEERYTHDEETDDYIENPNCPKINWQRFAIADKGYGYFRSWMDHGIEPATIVATIRELYQQKKSDSRELQFPAFNKRTPQQSLIMGAMQEMEDDPISVNWTSVSQLKRFNGAYIVGGARDQCLREVELLMNAFNIKYKRIDSLIYEGQQGVAENFADGKNPEDKGDSVRHGIPKHATMAELEKASHADGRKGQLARWQLNMRRGHKK